MTQARVKFASFEEYLDWSNDPANYMEGRFELIDGELVELAPESGVNSTIANRIFFFLVAAGIVPLEWVHPSQCELKVCPSELNRSPFKLEPCCSGLGICCSEVGRLPLELRICPSDLEHWYLKPQRFGFG